MSIEQPAEITDSRRLTLVIPEGLPAGRAQVVIRFPSNEEVRSGDLLSGMAVPEEARGQINSEDFRSILGRAQGAWKGKPWSNHMEDINTMRGEWESRDPWNRNSAERLS